MRIKQGQTALSDANPTDILHDVASAPGTGAAASRADHAHEVNDPGIPVVQAFGDAAAVGIGSEPAREDHDHGLPTAPRRSMFVQAHHLSGNGVHPAGDEEYGSTQPGNATQDGQAWVSGAVASDAGTVQKIVAVILPAETGNMRWNAIASRGSAGQDRRTGNAEETDATVAVVANVLQELDISTALAGLVAGNYFGVRFIRIGSHGADTVTTINFLGVLIEWD